ncbi:hypothetical protein [Actinomadura litoris]|uniref:hypothetical protein n=1 Tax=Actinomadura litoris TaxID=2678616 RepID=UPI001FA7B652|nr:hypothetical protein [Actinomadura litoris]
MTMPMLPGRRVVVTGVGAVLAAGMLVAGPSANAESADAADATQNGAVANTRYTAKWNIRLTVNRRTHRIRARGEITDTTRNKRVRVAVQSRIQRKDGRRWVTVYTGPRVERWEHAVSDTGLRGCARGKTYRGVYNFNYNRGMKRFQKVTRAVTC